MSERQQRADRILDAAGELLLRLGYRKVTMEDVARRADIGKGTLYLHWRTKKVLFQAMLLRESCTLLAEFAATLRDDPGEIRPHRFLRLHFLSAERNPLLRAVFTGDMEMLGALSDQRPTDEMLSPESFYDVMTQHGLLRTDIPNIEYGINATSSGFFLFESLNVELPEPELTAKADLLAHTIRMAYEPAEEPPEAAVSAAANQMSLMFEHLRTTYQKWIYEHDPEQLG